MDKKKFDLNSYCLELENENRDLKNRLYIDKLTGLPNILSYNKDIKDLDHPKAVVVDIDAFSEINEYFGRDAGDNVLKEIAQAIENYANYENMKAYRIGSDQFMLLESGSLDIEKYERIAQELVHLLKTREIHILGFDDSVVFDSTIGFCLEDDETLNKALIALSHAKKAQKDYACYLHSMSNEVSYKDKVIYTKLLKKALDDDKVTPYYQPIYDRDKKLIKYEVLMRVEDSEGNTISPNLFMLTSKKVRLYSLMTKVMIEKSFKEISKTDKSLSINLLARDMMDGDVNNFIFDKIKEYGVAKQVVFEILEDESIENQIRVENFIEKAKRMGVKIAIDDFGTGYSNFSYMMKIKPDYLKIDGSIIKNIDKDKNSKAILKAIVSFAKALQVKTIAEFVHSKEVYDICYSLGVDEFQGFYLAEPREKMLNNDN